jgi:hypothetical protein
MNSYLITPADFLYISQELGHTIELCAPTVTQQSDPTLGFSAGISYTKRKLRGHVIEQKAAIPTATGIIRAVANLIACVSSLDFKISDLNTDVRINYQGELYQIEHQKEYTHQGTSIYHQLKLISSSNFRTHSDAQPDNNLDHVSNIAIQPNTLTPPQADFDF